MTTRPTTLVESDQLAQAAANILKTEDFVPKSKRWPFSRVSKAHREYDKAVLEISARRREAREKAADAKTKKARAEADATFETAKAGAQGEHDAKLNEARKPYEELEVKARAARDAAIAAAHLAYQQATEDANRTYIDDAAKIAELRDGLIAQARVLHEQACAAADAERKKDLAQIDRDLRTIAVEGVMRLVEDREAWPTEARKKALAGIVDMVGGDEFDWEYADLCLRNVAGYVFQDRYLKPEAEHQRLMDTRLLEALVELAQAYPDRRPLVVKWMHEIVMQNPGHSSPQFIKNLTQLYVAASADTQTVYADDPVENESVFETMREHIADTLKLTPRRSHVPPPPSSKTGARGGEADDHSAATKKKAVDPEITADVSIGDLMPVDEETPDPESAKPSGKTAAPKVTSKRPPPLSQRSSRVRTPEGST